MEKYFPVLRKCSLFRHINYDKLSALLTCLATTIKQYDKKETILEEGVPAKYIGIMLSGAEVPSIPISVITTEPSEIMLIDCQRIIHSCTNACDFHQQIEIITKRSTHEKLTSYLTLQAQKANRQNFDIPFAPRNQRITWKWNAGGFLQK